jgi:hypothetical protein
MELPLSARVIVASLSHSFVWMDLIILCLYIVQYICCVY